MARVLSLPVYLAQEEAKKEAREAAESAKRSAGWTKKWEKEYNQSVQDLWKLGGGYLEFESQEEAKVRKAGIAAAKAEATAQKRAQLEARKIEKKAL